MERSVSSFKVAIGKGHEPSLYTYDPTLMPLGEFDALLDFKTWSKRIIAINCYFTKIDTAIKFVITVYCNNRTGRYAVYDSTIDFSTCATGAAYRITIEKHNKAKITLIKAESVILSKASE